MQVGAVVQGRLIYEDIGKSEKVVHLKQASGGDANPSPSTAPVTN